MNIFIKPFLKNVGNDHNEMDIYLVLDILGVLLIKTCIRIWEIV